jgi:predicted ATPase
VDTRTLLRQVELKGLPPADRFPFGLPSVRALAEPLVFHPEVTFLVGENGSGKSTIIEAIAEKLALDAEGGDADLTFIQNSVDSPLFDVLRLVRGPRRPSMRYFLRAESFFNVARDVDQTPGRLGAYGGRPLHEMSHGESFLALAIERLLPDGIYLFDEPEAALSPQGCLTLLRRMRELAIEGAQFIVATHSPLLMAYPGATIYELSERGIEQVAYEDTDHYRLTKTFLDDPARFLHHLFG